MAAIDSVDPGSYQNDDGEEISFVEESWRN